jgi:hypothetical protein
VVCGHRLYQQNIRSRVRISPGWKFFRNLNIPKLFLVI